MVTVWSPARLRAYCRALRTRCAAPATPITPAASTASAVPTSGEAPNRTAHSAVEGYRSSPVAVTSTGTARKGPTAWKSRPLRARSTTAGGTTTTPTSVAVTDGVIPVPIVESGTSTPYPTQACTRVDRGAASTASTVGTSGQANSTARPSRLRGPISTRPAASHTAPSTRPQASPATT